jgi:hypothetical protein
METLNRWLDSVEMGALCLAVAASMICEHLGMSRGRGTVVGLLILFGLIALSGGHRLSSW